MYRYGCCALLLFGFFLGNFAAFADAPAQAPDLQLRATLDKPVYETGEAIPVTIILVNHGESQYLVQASTELTGALDGWSFTIADAKGQRVGHAPERLRATNWIGSWLALKRDEKAERQIFLNHWTQPLPPGEYTVEVSYIPHSVTSAAPHDWPAIRSSKVKFQIEPVTRTKLEVRIARLTQQSSKGDMLAIDFLGFNGEKEGIDPLLDVVYAEDPQVQHRAAMALTYLLDQSMVLSSAVARVKEQGLNCTMAEWLVESGAPGPLIVPLFLKAVKSTEPNLRAAAFKGLRLHLQGMPNDPRYAAMIRPHMQEGLEDSDGRVRYEAVVALENNPDKETLRILDRMSRSDPVSRVREAASVVMRRTGKTSAATTSAAVAPLGD